MAVGPAVLLVRIVHVAARPVRSGGEGEHLARLRSPCAVPADCRVCAGPGCGRRCAARPGGGPVNECATRYGMRGLAGALLVLALVGGYLLNVARHVDQRRLDAAHAAAVEADELHQLRVMRARQWLANAPVRAAQADAQAKADAVADAAADQGKAVDDAVRRAQAASRSDDRASSVDVPSSCSDYSGNRAIGCALLLDQGFALDQMPCLDKIWNKESGWNTTAENPSGAYGIPQAKPASQMAKYGSDYRTNPVTQIKWGLDYIERRYKTPCGAWSYWQEHHWY